MLGVVLIAIPPSAMVKELGRSGIKDPLLDPAGIFLAVVLYLTVGRLFIILANKISSGKQLFREQDEQRRDVWPSMPR